MTPKKISTWINDVWSNIRDGWWCNGCTISPAQEEALLEEFEELFGDSVSSETIEAAIKAADPVAGQYIGDVLSALM